jgi:hypothetical protein
MPDKENTLVDVYGKNAPDAAKFGVGAKTLSEVQKATDARQRASEELSKPSRD